MKKIHLAILSVWLGVSLCDAQPTIDRTKANLPFVQPALSVLRSSPHKVFAHYFPLFAVSIDNKPAAADYYSVQYLVPQGENGKFAAVGGFLRDRPLPRLPRPEANWRDLDLEDEVRRAAALGLDGFTVDILVGPQVDPKTGQPSPVWQTIVRLMAAAQQADPGFKIVLMPDMSGFKTHPEDVMDVIRTLNQSPAAYRLADGRLVVSPYLAETESAAWWKEHLDTLRQEKIDVAFVPLFQGWQNYAVAFSSISAGFSDWGSRTPTAALRWSDAAAKAHAFVPIWMMPVSPQDVRPKSSIYSESGNSLTFRRLWQTAIDGGSDWIQLITWNDYSESTQVAPSVGTGFSFYDLAAYYTTWFKTGQPPKITRDVLYFFHRVEPTTAPPDPIYKPMVLGGGDPAANDIEVVTFLTAPAQLEVKVGGKTTSFSLGAGMASSSIPLTSGQPEFRVVRGGQTVISTQSPFDIQSALAIQDLSYKGGDASADQVFSSTATSNSVPSAGLSPRVYPNPWRSDLHSGHPLTFDQLPPNSTLKIFTLSGSWVKTISNVSGKTTWDLKNNDGTMVAAGIYLYQVTNEQNQKAKGKFTIIR